MLELKILYSSSIVAIDRRRLEDLVGDSQNALTDLCADMQIPIICSSPVEFLEAHPLSIDLPDFHFTIEYKGRQLDEAQHCASHAQFQQRLYALLYEQNNNHFLFQRTVKIEMISYGISHGQYRYGGGEDGLIYKW